MDTSKLHSVIVNALVYRDGKILVSQRSFEEKHEPGKWTIPGGKIEKTPGDVFGVIESTAAREVEEETGVEVAEDAGIIVSNNTFIRSDGTHVIAIMVLVPWVNGEPEAKEDTIAVDWVGPHNYQEKEYAPNVKGYLEAAFERMEGWTIEELDESGSFETTEEIVKMKRKINEIIIKRA